MYLHFPQYDTSAAPHRSAALPHVKRENAHNATRHEGGQPDAHRRKGGKTRSKPLDHPSSEMPPPPLVSMSGDNNNHSGSGRIPINRTYARYRFVTSGEMLPYKTRMPGWALLGRTVS
jgi:hypothetical protein